MKTLLSKALLLSVLIFSPQLGPCQHLTHQQLLEDTRQLADMIEKCHPDPYQNTNGKIGFKLSIDNLLESLPKEGMDTEDFWWHLSSLTATIKDGHTYLYPLKYPDSNIFPSLAPLER